MTDDLGSTRTEPLRAPRPRRPGATVLGGAALATLAVVLGVVGMALLDDEPDPSTPTASPAPAPASTPAPVDRLSPAQVIDHPDARLRELVVAPGSPQTRGALWQLCLDEGCTRRQQALAVTGDGFRTRQEIVMAGRAQPVVVALSADAFYVERSRRSRMIVRTDGRAVPVQVDAPTRPLGAGEVRVGTWNHRQREWALDPDTGRMHPIPVPEGASGLVGQPEGALLGLVHDGEPGSSRAVWSTDGGASWREQVLATGPNAMVSPLVSARPGVLAVVEGADGATLFPFLHVHRSRDGGATWETFDMPRDPQAYVGAAAVLPDGRLLANLEAWSDERRNRPGARPAGLYVSAGLDWSDLSPVPVGAPFSVADPNGYHPVAMDTTTAGVAAYAYDGAGGTAADRLYVSRDAGRRWRALVAR